MVDFGLGEFEVLAKTGDLGAESAGGSVEPRDVDRDDGVDVRERSGHFSYFFEDDVMC